MAKAKPAPHSPTRQSKMSWHLARGRSRGSEQAYVRPPPAPPAKVRPEPRPYASTPDPARPESRAGHRTSISASPAPRSLPVRSEEHTSELQSLMRISYAVFCLKKKTKL